MIDGNQLREEFGRYLAEHKATRWGMDAALMHVCKIAYDAGKADGPGAALHSREYEIEVPAEPGLHPLKFTGLPLQNWRDEQHAAAAARGTWAAAGATHEGEAGMTDYMKEAKRLLNDFALLVQMNVAGLASMAQLAETRAALLAHIERGRVHFLAESARYKVSGNALRGLPSELNGRWVALVAADDDCHMKFDAAPAAPDGRADEQAAFEKWLDRTCPSGDVEAVQRQWEASSDYAELIGAAPAVPAPAEVPMPKPVAYGFGNTAITGHTNRLMMVRIDIPGGDQYAGAFWLPLVLADEAHTYGVACRAAGEAAGYAQGLRDAVRDAAPLVQNGEVLVTVTGLTGSGKSAIAGEIEIMCRALGLEVEWVGGDAEKRLTHADWTDALEMYRPRVRIIEANIPRTDAALRGEVK